MTDTHIWSNKEMPAHVQNIKDWTLQVDDKLLLQMRSTVEYMYRMVYDERHLLTEDQEEVVDIVARETLDELYNIARENGIEIWRPTADSYEF